VFKLPSKPHGGKLVNRILVEDKREKLIQEASEMPSVNLDSKTLMDLWQIAVGGYSPLEGFMTREDYESVLNEMRLTNGLPWTLPITLPTNYEGKSNLEGEEVCLKNEMGKIVAILSIEDDFKADLELEAEKVYGCRDPNHPGVKRTLKRPNRFLGGSIWLLNEPNIPYREVCLTPEETRREFAKRGWKTIAAFQTRNPPHLAHEHLQRIALEILDGLLIHPVIGERGEDDFPPEAIIEAYNWLIENIYPKERVLLSCLATWMRFAGPREAVFHAIVRKNYGCTHFVIGRKHASPSGWYKDYDAHRLAEEFRDELGIELLLLKGPYYCKVCGKVATEKTCGHGPEKRIPISMPEIRRMLREGLNPPSEMIRPQIAEILSKYYGKKQR